MSLTIGQTIYNRYRIARLLGQGGMGAVYRAWDLNLNIPVALKELVPEPGIDPATLAQLRQQFQREARLLASLSHPSLPRVTDHFEWGGNAYLVMDFVEGESLDALIARQGPLPEEQVVKWAGQLLGALATCHAQHIIHRDIKPLNIIITPSSALGEGRGGGRAVLVDFGLVKLWDPRHPQTQRIVHGMGTPAYASPEHFGIGGQHTQPRSDLYSLGATLYHALTGREPATAVERGSTTSSFINPRRLRAGLRPETESVILRAMALDLNYRFRDTREMTSALGAGSNARVGPVVMPPPVSISSIRRASVPATIPHDRWQLEMATAMAMAVVGTLTLQIILYASHLSPERYFNMSLGALVMGAIGWFVGDSIFEALTQSQGTGATTPVTGSRPTQRLVAFTRQLTRQLSTSQQVALLLALLIGSAAAAWLLGPLALEIPLLWNYVPTYAIAGPLVYAATGRRQWRALVAHTLVTTLGGTVLKLSVGFGSEVGPLFLAAVVGGLLMEGVAFLAERQLLRK